MNQEKRKEYNKSIKNYIILILIIQIITTALALPFVGTIINLIICFTKGKKIIEIYNELGLENPNPTPVKILLVLISIIPIPFNIFVIIFMYAMVMQSQTQTTSEIQQDNITKTEVPKTKEQLEMEEKQTEIELGPIVPVDVNYLKSEDAILKGIIDKTINGNSANLNHAITKSQAANIKKLILIGIILSTVLTTMYYLNFSMTPILLIGAIFIIIFLIFVTKDNYHKNIIKEIKSNPDKEIDQIVLSKKDDIVKNKWTLVLKGLIPILAIVILESVTFVKPKMFFKETEDGYNLKYYTRSLNPETDVVIPNEYKGKKVVGIDKKVFKGLKIRKVTLPENLESIKKEAFANCDKLETITLPKSLKEIREGAFSGDEDLRNVEFNEGLIEIRASAFEDCTKLRNLILPDSLEYLGANAFNNCSLITEVTIPEKITEIFGATFANCSMLKKVNLHDKIESIHGEVFQNDYELKEIKLPPLIKEIRGNTFENCYNLKEIDIPEGVVRIGAHAFYGCYSLERVSVPSTVTEIGSSAFRMCGKLSTIDIPKEAVVNEKAFKESPTIINRY